MWRSLAAHLLWEQGVGSSNLPIPTGSPQAGQHDGLVTVGQRAATAYVS